MSLCNLYNNYINSPLTLFDELCEELCEELCDELCERLLTLYEKEDMIMIMITTIHF